MRIFDLALTLPWLCTEDYVRLILDIAAREQSDVALAVQLRAERAERPNALAARAGRPLDGTRDVMLRDGVAIVPIIGPIVRRADFFSLASGGTSTATIAQDLTRALDDPAVDAILLEIDSPGGEATGIHELAAMLYDARGRKPITAYVEGLGASAAYWIASAADAIVASATAGLGSIGAVMAVYDPLKTKTQQIEFVSSQSPRKRLDPHTEAGKAGYQRIVDDLAEVFIGAVAAHRGVSEERVLSDFGQGGLLIGRHAVAAGLADRLGSFEATLSDLHAQVRDGRQQSTRLLATTHQEDAMRMSDVWSGFFKGAKDAGVPIEDDGGAQPRTVQSSDGATWQTAPLTSTQLALMERSAAPLAGDGAELAQLKQQLAGMQAREREGLAAAFADGAVRDRRALPAEREELLSLYALALSDDAASPVAAGQTTRAGRLDQLLKARPQHALTQELVPVALGGALPANTGGDDELAAADASARAYAQQTNRKRPA